MKKATLAVALLVVISTFCLVVTRVPDAVVAVTLFVGGSDPSNYTTIQSAIDAADPGDTIYVFNGTYYENVEVNKTLSLVGEDRDTTIVDGSWPGIVFCVTADWVNITGFTILNGSAGIELHSSNHTSIVGNNISDNRGGIFVYSSTNTSVFDNHLQGGSDGVMFFYSRDSSVARNTFHLNSEWGIGLENSHNITFANNTASSNRYGIYLWQSNGNVVVNNNLSSSMAHSIRLVESNNNVVSSNSLSDTGIYFIRSNNNTLVNNTLSANEQYIHLFSSLNNTLLNNTITDGYIDISGMSLGHWNTHTIDTSNTVKGKPVYYLKDLVGGTVPTDAGEVLLANCTGMQVENQNLNNYGKSILVGFSSDSVITKSNFSSPSVAHIYLLFSDNITINENNFSAGVDVEYSNNVTISNNEYLSSDGGISAFFSSNMTIADNVVPSGRFWIFLGGLDNANVSNNVGSLGGKFELGGCIDSMAFNNTLSDGGLIDLQGTYNVTVAGNRDVGISLMYSDDSVVADNSISYKSSSGIATYGSFNNIFVRNTIIHNPLGISMRSSFNNTILNNNISNNVQGILFNNTSQNVVRNNTISGNGNGVILESSAGNNSIYHNKFISNMINAVDLSNSNHWDNGYPSGGNYWSNYIGTDDLSGPDQNELGSDGIGDTPYIIGFFSQDRYPFMSPSGPIFPRPPLFLFAKLTGRNVENVTLDWVGSPDDGFGLESVVRYDIYKNSTYDPSGQIYELVASVPNGTYRFDDAFAGEGNPNDYFYLVCSVDMNSNSTCVKNQAGKFTRELTVGPNLVSVPLLTPGDIETTLQTVKWDKAWAFDTYIQRWKWQMKSKPYPGELNFLNNTMAFWIDVTEDSNLTVAGVVPTITSIALQSGWNLVGFPSFNSTYTIGDLKAQTTATRIEGFSPSDSPYNLKLMMDVDVLQAGFGYWVKVDSDTVWTVAVS